MKNYFHPIGAIILMLFGLLTIFMGGSVIFDLFDIRAKEGNYVLFVVWANFICGFLYVIAASGFYKAKVWTIKPLTIALIILLFTFMGLYIYIKNGEPFENKTLYAMTFRTIITVIFIMLSYYKINKTKVIS